MKPWRKILAKNNVGLITTELISLYSHDRFSDYSHSINSPLFIKDFKEITSIVHQFNVPILAQVGFVNCNVNGKQMIEVNDLTIEDIRKIQADYLVAAKKVAFAGFDGIQLSIGNNYYLSRIMNPFENQRDDDYGGNTYNRVRIAVEIIWKIHWKYVRYLLRMVLTVCRLQNSCLRNISERDSPIRICWLSFVIRYPVKFKFLLF